MKKAIFLVLSVFLLSGCAVWHSMVPQAKPDSNAGIAPLSPYSGLKARIAVADFEIKAAKATSEAGLALHEMLVTALTNSNRFTIAERPVTAGALQETEVSVSNTTQADPLPEQNKSKAADLLVTVALTEFDPEFSGGRSGLGGGGGIGSGAMGGLLGTSFSKAYIALEMRVSDAVTSEVLSSTRVQGQASDIYGSFAAGFFGKWDLGAGLSAYANTPMEKAIRICLIEAVRYFTQTIPASYYKY